MIGILSKNSQGDVNQPISQYQPTKAVAELTGLVQKDYAVGEEILQRVWTELNNRSVLDDDQRGKMMFNAFVDTDSSTPEEEWKWKGTRSRARNKAIATHANLAANFWLPMYVAQNTDDEEDAGFSEVMRDGIEWMSNPTVSNYHVAFFQVTLASLYSPIVYMSAEYYEAYMQNRKLGKEMLDDVLSGFQCQIWSANQILFANAFERNLQKQRFIIRRRYCEYEELEAIYGRHPNWQYVQKGIRSIYNSGDGLFYDIKDDQHSSLVAEEIWESRRRDLEIPFINGIYMGKGEPESQENAIRHRDNFNNPKYNLVDFGYSRIGTHFIFYKSLMSVLQWENMKYDAMDEVIMNRALLEVDFPVFTKGIDSDISRIAFPNSITQLPQEAEIGHLLPPSNLAAGFNILKETEEGMDDTSAISSTREGQLPDASQKAYSVAKADAGALKILRAVARPLAESMAKFGDLMKDVFINHYTTAEVQEITGETLKLKYRQFFLSKQDSTGNKVDKNIKFDESLIGASMSEKEKRLEGYRRLDKIKYKPGQKESVIWVNPEMFVRFKYLCKIDLNEMFSNKNNEYWQQMMLALVNQFANNPFANLEELTRETFNVIFQSKGDKFMNDQAKLLGMPPGVITANGGQPGQANQMVNQFQNKMTAGMVDQSGTV